MLVGLVTYEFALLADHDEPAISIGRWPAIQRYILHLQPRRPSNEREIASRSLDAGSGSPKELQRRRKAV